MIQPLKRARVVVLISGGGSNLQSLIDATKRQDCPFEVVFVISNRPNAGGLTRANVAGIDNALIDHKKYPDRVSFETDLAAMIDAANPDIIACAGFMRVLTESFVARFHGQIINIHPSLLPNFRGLDTHVRALDAGVAFAGCTVHWLSTGVDEGAIIGQAIVPVLRRDTPAELAARVLIQEHRLYPTCLSAIARGQAVLRDGQNYFGDKRGALAMMPDGSFVH